MTDGEKPVGVAGGAALWHGRFAAAPAEELMAFTESLSYDRRLLIDDVAASKAHARGPPPWWPAHRDGAGCGAGCPRHRRDGVPHR